MFPRTVLVAVLLSIEAWLPAQSSTPGTFDLARNREPVVVLDGSWRSHPGDDPDRKLGWANADLDDSTWPLIRGDKTWNVQGYKNLDGFAWYRTRVEIPAGQQDVALNIPLIETSYQVFADGKLLGGEGGIPPYVNGHELMLENGLPIGIAPGIKYPENTFSLLPDARLTLLTDGVLEATNPTTKELFGFDPTTAISNQSAEAIALAAQQFGQGDDITELTLRFAGSEVTLA